jgi:hypothetical protein
MELLMPPKVTIAGAAQESGDAIAHRPRSASDLPICVLRPSALWRFAKMIHALNLHDGKKEKWQAVRCRT